MDYFAGLKRRELQALCKRHGLPAGGTNAALAARLADAAVLPGDTSAEDEVVARKGCLKRPDVGNDLGEAKKVSFALEESRRRRRQSQVAFSPAVVANTRVRSKAKAETRSASSSPDAEAGRRGRGRQIRAEAVGVSAEAGAGAPVRRSRRSLAGLGGVEAMEEGETVAVDKQQKQRNEEKEEETAVSAQIGVPRRVTRRSSLAGTALLSPLAVEKKGGRRKTDLGGVEAVEGGETVALDRKRKQRSKEKEEETAVSSQVEVPRRVTRRSSLAGAVLLSPLAVEKKGGRRKAADGKNKLDAEEQVAEAQGLTEATLPVTAESKRNGGKRENCDLVVQKSAKMEAPIVIESTTRRTTEYEQLQVQLPTNLEVPRNDAPVTRVLRNRVVQVDNSVEENERQPSRPATCRDQQLASSMEEDDQEQVLTPSKCPPLRRSKRNNLELKITESETNKLNSLPMEADSAKGEDGEKQPTVKGPARRSTRKSVVSAMLEEGNKDLVAETGLEAQVKTLKRKSVVPVRNSNGDGEKNQDAKGKDVVKQPMVKDPVRRSTRKSVISSMLKEDDGNIIAHMSPEAQVRTLKRKSVVLIKDSKGNDEGTQNAMGKDVVKQLTVKVPVRRSTRRSVALGMLENRENDFIAAKKSEAHDKRSVRKSVPPNMFNKKNQDHSKMTRNEGKGGEKHLDVQGSVRLSRQVATDKKENKGHGETKSEILMTNSTHQSVTPNSVDTGDMDLTDMVGRETGKLKARAQITEHPVAIATSENKLQVEVSIQNSLRRSRSCEKADQEVLKLRKHRRFSVEISSPSNYSCNVVDLREQKFRNQSNTQTPDKIDNKGNNQEKTTSKGRPVKRRRTTVQEEVISVEEAKFEGTVSREPICNTVTCGNESSNRIHEICQVKTTREEFSSRPLLITLPVQTRHNVIPGVESADDQNPEIYPSHGMETSKKSNQTQEYYDVQTDNGLLSETTNGEWDQSSSIRETLQHNDIVSEDKMLRDVGEVNFSNTSIQIVNASSDEVGLDILNKSSGRSTTAVLIVDGEAHPMVDSPTVNAEIKQLDSEVSPIVSSCCDGITVTVRKPQFAGKKDSQGVSADASGSAPPISDSKQESHSVELSIQAADLRKYISKDIKGNPLSSNLHTDGADADNILPALGAAKGSSSDENHSSFGLDFLFAEEHKGSSSTNDINTAVEVDYESKTSSCLTPSICMKSDCGMECENVQPLGYDADKTLDVSQDVAQEEFIAEKSTDERVVAEIDLKTKSNYEAVLMKSDYILAEENRRLVADNGDAEHTVIQVKQDAVHGGTLEKSSLCSTAPESKHECRLPDEGLHSIKNKRCSSRAEQSPLGLQSLFSQESLDNSMEHGALACGTSLIESGVEQLKDCHVTYTVEKTTASQSISHQDTHLVSEFGDSMCMSQKSNGIEGSPEISHDGELVSSSLSGFLEDVNHRKEVIKSVELVCKGEGNRNIFHSEDLNISCEKPEDDVSVSCNVLSCSLHTPDTDNVDVRLGSNLCQLESVDLLDKQIRSSSTEVQHPSQKEHCIEDRENQVAVRPGTGDIMEATTTKCIESGAVLLPVEGSENLKDDQLNSKLKSAQAVECDCNSNKDISNTLDDGSFVCIVSERNSLGITLPKDYPADHLEKSLEEFAMSGGANVSNAGTVQKSSFHSAMSEPKGALFEEVVHQMKNYVGTSPSNPKELLIELQSTSPMETIEESDLDNLVLPISGFGGNESTIVEHVKVHSGSNLSMSTSNDFLDESIWCSDTEVLHQGQKKQCNGDSTEEQVASGLWTYDKTDAATAKYIESEVHMFRVEGRSELQDGQLNSTQDGSSGIVFGKFLFGDESDSRVGGCIENSLSGLAPSNHNHKGVLSEEVMNITNKNPRELLMELQSSPNETLEDVNPCDSLTFPSAERERDASTICHVENLVDTVVSLEPDLYLGPSQGLRRDEGKQGCMSVSLHDDEGICQSSDWMLTEENNSRPSSCDVEVLRQDHVEECHEVNEDEVTPAALEK